MLSKILVLLRTQEQDDQFLGFYLLAHQKFPSKTTDPDSLQEVLEQLSYNFKYNLNKSSSPEVIALEYLELIIIWLSQNLNTMKALNLEPIVTELIGKQILSHYPDYLNLRPKWDQAIRALSQRLDRVSYLNSLHFSRHLELIEKDLSLWGDLGNNELEFDNYLVWKIWLAEFRHWKGLLYLAERQRRFVLPILKSIKNYLINQVQFSTELFDLLQKLWNTIARINNLELLEEFISLTQISYFSRQQRQQLLLRHPIFEFPERHCEYIGGMPADEEFNLYDLLAKDVGVYAYSFKSYLALLKKIEGEELLYLKSQIYEAWSYYYQTELIPYLQFIQQKDSEDPHIYFYLAQANALEGKATEAIDLYMRYISLAPLEIPENNFFISEMNYSTRTYPPSALEAITHIGYLYEHELENEERALYYYKQSISLCPKHHQAAYWEMIKYMLGKGALGPELFRYVRAYTEIIFFKTNWENPKDYVWNIVLEIDKYRREATAWKEQLTIYDPDFKRKFGFIFLKSCLLSLLWELAEYFQEAKNYSLSFEATVLAKKIYKTDHIRSKSPFQFKKIELPFYIYEILWEDILYLQACNILRLQKDYWQAQVLFQQILKTQPHHKGAQCGLKEIRVHLGY